MRMLQLPLAAVGAVVCLLSAGTAKATVIGHLDTANCDGGGVTVSASLIDWLPAGTGTGCIVTGTGTAITFAGVSGSLGVGVTGTIKDLTLGPPATISDFMTFTGNPDLHFDLTALGPAPSTICTAATPLFTPCSAAPGSPFSLTNTGTGVLIGLSASGNARDASPNVSQWSGAFTTQVSSCIDVNTGQTHTCTPIDIVAIIGRGGSITSTHSGDFSLTFTAVPEPGTMGTLLFAGMSLVAVGLRRRKA